MEEAGINKPFEIPRESDELKARPKWVTGDAKQEDRNWDTLEETKLNNDKRWLVIYGWVLVAITLAIGGIFVLSLLAWAWHYIGPSQCHWLGEPQLNKIQSALFSGGMGAVISGIIRTQIGKAT